MIQTAYPEHSGRPEPLSWDVALEEGWSLKRLEDEYIRAVLSHTSGHQGRAANILGIDRRTLYRKLRQLTHEPSMT
jgi:DNA-binding NtrC family response regulator